MSKLTWEQFVCNVQNWAKKRGIYDHSTPTAQLLKTLSELGEVADAVIKNDREALADGIGDVAVCLVNYWTMMDKNLENSLILDDSKLCSSNLSDINIRCFSSFLEELSGLLHGNESFLDIIEPSFDDIYLISVVNGLDFMTCCTSAWEEIKDRKGRMVAGGAFVKDE